jgi:hypothetical protein
MSEINYGAIATEWNRGGARRVLTELERQGFVIMPIHPTAAMITEAMYPARPGSIGDMYREMVKVGRVTA